jgi:hypothetical protein
VNDDDEVARAAASEAGQCRWRTRSIGRIPILRGVLALGVCSRTGSSSSPAGRFIRAAGRDAGRAHRDLWRVALASVVQRNQPRRRRAASRCSDAPLHRSRAALSPRGPATSRPPGACSACC